MYSIVQIKLILSETVTRLSILMIVQYCECNAVIFTWEMTVKYEICFLHKSKSNCCCDSFRVFIDYMTRRANISVGIRGELIARTRIQVIGLNFDQGERNLTRASREFELSKFELSG